MIWHRLYAVKWKTCFVGRGCNVFWYSPSILSFRVSQALYLFIFSEQYERHWHAYSLALTAAHTWVKIQAHVRTHYTHELIMCTLARAGLVSHSITVSSSVDVVGGEWALQRAGLLGVDLLLCDTGWITGTGAPTGMGRSIRHNWTFSWGAGWTGSTFTLRGRGDYKCVSMHESSNHAFLRFFWIWQTSHRLQMCPCKHHHHQINQFRHTLPLSRCVEIILQLLHHWIEQFPSFQLVFAGSAPASTGGCGVKQANIRG